LAGRRAMHIFHIGLETGKEIVVGQRKRADLHPKNRYGCSCLTFQGSL
jgi:hypothetical protein